MAGLLSPAALASARRALAVFFVHTYTRTRVAAGEEDPEGHVARVPGTGVPGQPCTFSASSRLVVSGVGVVEDQTPTIAVPTDDPLAVGDLVSDVRDATGGVLAAGPLRVERDRTEAGLGAPLKKVFALRGADPRGGS